MDQKKEIITMIRPIGRWEVLDFRQVLAFRDLLFAFGSRDIKLRYRQTVLGVAWVLLQPLLASLVMSFVFNRVANLQAPNGLPYFVFSYAGMMGWNLFNTTLIKASGSLVLNTTLVSKIYFPKVLLPLSSAFSNMLDFCVALLLLLIMLPIFGVGITWQILLTPVWMFFFLLASLGIGVYSSSLMVSFRDVQYVLPVLMNLVFYASPIAYGLNAVPEGLQGIISLNPLTGLLEGLRWSLLGTGQLNMGAIAYSLIASTAMFLGGCLLFGRVERRFADVI